MIYPCHCAYHHYNAGFHTYACSLLSLLPCIHVGIQRKRGINLVFGYGSHQKKTGKKLHNSCELSPKMENPPPPISQQFQPLSELENRCFWQLLRVCERGGLTKTR